MLVRGGQRCRPSCQSIDYLLCPSCQSIDYLLCPLSVSRSLTRTSLATRQTSRTQSFAGDPSSMRMAVEMAVEMAGRGGGRGGGRGRAASRRGEGPRLLLSNCSLVGDDVTGLVISRDLSRLSPQPADCRRGRAGAMRARVDCSSA